MKDSEYAHKAVTILEERGHCKGDYVSSTGAVCALGALGLATGYFSQEGDYISYGDTPDNWAHEKTYSRLRSNFRTHLARDPLNQLSGDISEWNDTADTTAETVILELKRFASMLEARGE